MTTDLTALSTRDTTLALTFADVIYLHSSQLARILDTLGWICDLSARAGRLEKEDEEGSAFVTEGRPGVRSATAYGLPIRRIRFASPLEIIVYVSTTATASATGLASMIYLLRRLYGADFEIRTGREEQRRLFLEAKRRTDAVFAHETSPRPEPNPDVLDPQWRADSLPLDGWRGAIVRRLLNKTPHEIAWRRRPTSDFSSDPRHGETDISIGVPGIAEAAMRRAPDISPVGTVRAVLDDQTLSGADEAAL